MLKSYPSQYDATYQKISEHISDAEQLLERANRTELSDFERKLLAEKFDRTLNNIRSGIKKLETIVIVESRVEEKRPVTATTIAANPGLYEMFDESIFLRQRQLSIEQIESIIERERELRRYRGGESRISAFTRLLRKLADGFQVLKKVTA
jgi:hypothetical protein